MASFGFSIGDIILLSQISYKLYQTITSGRQKAGRDLQELKDVLFGLQCALGHLRHVAGDISSVAALSHLADGEEKEMQQALDRMIQNCARTLQDLDTATVKYRGSADQLEENADAVDSGPSLKWRIRLKKRVASDWAKIKWDMDKDDMKRYREKLQAHTDSINLVLNTFLWSTTKKIHADGKGHAEEMQKFAEKMVAANSSLEGLIKSIRSMLSNAQEGAVHQSLPLKMYHGGSSAREISDKELNFDPMGLGAGAGGAPAPSVAAHYSPLALHHSSPYMVNMAVAELDMNSAAMLAVGSAHPWTKQTPLLAARTERRPQPIPARPAKELPPKIIAINLKRQRQRVSAIKPDDHHAAPKPRPSFLDPRASTVMQLLEGLEFVFSLLPRTTMRQLELARQARGHEIKVWIQSLDQMLDSVARSRLDPAGEGRSTTLHAQQGDMTSLLTKMNALIEDSGRNLRGVFYESAAAARLDDVLDKVLTLTKSVRAQKEVDEFIDEREDWTKEH